MASDRRSTVTICVQLCTVRHAADDSYLDGIAITRACTTNTSRARTERCASDRSDARPAVTTRCRGSKGTSKTSTRRSGSRRRSSSGFARIRAELRDELADRAGLVERQAEAHERTLKKIAAKQEKLVQLFYDDLVDRKVFEREQIKLKAEAKAAERLRRVAIVQSENAEQALDEALERLSDIERIYREGTPIERRILNRAIFKRIEIGEDGEITKASLTPTYEALSAWKPTLGKPTAIQNQDRRRPRLSSFVRPTADGADWGFGKLPEAKSTKSRLVSPARDRASPPGAERSGSFRRASARSRNRTRTEHGWR